MDGNGDGAERCDIGAFERVPVVNLSISKTDSPDPVTVGGTLTYTVTVTNNSTIPALGVVVADTLPAGVTFVSASPGCAQSAGTVTCNLGNINGAANVAISIVVTPTMSAVSPIVNTAAITGGNFSNTGQTQATQSTTISSADMTVSKSDSPDPVVKGAVLTYTVIVTNSGPGTATGVTIADSLPPGVALVSATPSQGSCSGSLPVTCNFGTVPRLATASAIIAVTPNARGSISNYVSVSAISPDPNLLNNSAWQVTTVAPAPFTVNSTADLADTTPGDEICATPLGCTLRAAIMEANASVGADTIILPAGTYTLSIAGRDEDSAATGDLDIVAGQPLTITGADASTTIIDANQIDRVFYNLGGLMISRVTIRNGDSGSVMGGGILNLGSLTLQDAIISGNHAQMGGGIANPYGASAIVRSTTFTGNSADGSAGNPVGGGIGGGGIYSTGGLDLTNVTISGNTAAGGLHGGLFFPGEGGGLNLVGNNNLLNVTIANNSADWGGGIHIFSGQQTTRNTIIANNTAGNCIGSVNSSGNNLEGANTCGLNQAGDKINTNPVLGPLQNNGGQTPTQALLAGSPAIDAGTNSGCPATDQRGVPRPQDGDWNGTQVCDIGAFELLLPSPTIANINPSGGPAAGGQLVTITGTNLSGASVTIGGNAATVTGTTETTATFTTPVHAVGAVDVTVTASGGSVTAVGGYTYFPLSTPSSFSATATSTSEVALIWSAVSGATSYEVWRSSFNGPYSLASSPSGTSANDTGLSADTTYLYKVRAIGGAGTSAFTAIDPATTVVFNDPSLSGVLIQAVHVEQLRTAVNAMRAAAGLPAATFTDPTLTAGSTIIKRVHVTELRTALDAARSALGLAAISYTDPTITAGVTVMKAAHLTELRAGTQ